MIELNEKYKALFSNKNRYHLISGGRSSGKSYSVATYLLLLTLEKNNVILFCRYTMTSVKISVFPEFIDKINHFKLEHLYEITNNEIINKVTKSKIIFKGIKTGSSVQTANLKSIANLNVVVLEEAEEVPTEDIFDKIDLSARRKDKFNKIILLFNPTTKANWIYKKFYEKKGIEAGNNLETEDYTYIHTSYLDNIENISESIIKQLEAMKEDNPKKYEHIIMGAFLDVAEGVIYSNWKIGEFNNDLECYYGLDFGFSIDPTACIKVAIDKKNKKIYMDEVLYKTELTTSQIYNMLKDEVGKRLIVADNAEGRLIEELKRSGLNIRACIKGAGSVAEGIKLLQDFELIVTSTSTNLIEELNNYVWDHKKAGIPIDMYNHLCDSARYIVMDQLKNNKKVFKRFS